MFSFATIFVLVYFVSALSESPVMTLFHNEVNAEERSTMLSFRSVFLQFGAALGIGIAAYISNTYSIEAAFLVSGVIYLLSMSLMLLPKTLVLGVKLANAENEVSLRTQ